MSKINVNQVDTQCGSTLTLGSSGKTVTLASGASQSGFGRTGTVDWCTTAKTAPFTSVNGNGYFINTTSGAVTVTLPASPSAGDIVAFKDYGNTWQTNNVTVGRNGSNINGQSDDATLSTEAQSVTLIYVDATKGWQDIHDSTSDVTGENFVTATGGTVTTCGDFKIHTFTSDGCFSVTNAGSPSGSDKVSYLVVAGGGGGGRDRAGGGGAGGFREGKAPAYDTYTASPLVAPDGLPVSVQTYPITVGGGGSGLQSPDPASGDAGTGTNSVFSTITSAGGGRAGSGPGPFSVGGNGGSGGGSDAYGFPSNPANMGAGTGNSPPVTPPQGNDGGVGIYNSPNGTGRGGGGGGATVAGTGGQPGGNPGGAGATTNISGSPVGYAGGGGGGDCGSGQPTGTQGGGNGGASCAASTAGTVNRGGGGGGGNGGNGGNADGAGGGSGIVVIRYRFQN